MRVNVERDPDGRVAEHLGNDLRVDALAEQESRRRVPASGGGAGCFFYGRWMVSGYAGVGGFARREHGERVAVAVSRVPLMIPPQGVQVLGL